jgi:nicotinate-nucleotide adenylyltransferase
VRLGVFGGTFDPPHVGHLLAAIDAYEALALDRLVFVPASTQPLKAGARAAPAPDRLAMVRGMVVDDPRFSVDPIEIDREGLSYTVDTLAAFAERHPDAERFLLVGADVLTTFHRWREPGRVRQLARLTVMQRVDRRPAPGAADGLARGWQAGSGEDEAPPPPWLNGEDVVYLRTRRVDVSSTEIRARVRAGFSIRGFVPDAIAAYIERAGLYR